MKKLLAGVAAVAAAMIALPAGNSGAQADVDIMLLHGIPGVPVDVAVDGAVVLPAFQPGDMQDLSAFAGQTLTNLEVRLEGTDTVAIGPVDSFDVPASGSWTVVAHLDADGNATITPFENDTSAAGDGEGRLTIRHTAAAPAVDIVLGDDRPVEGAANGDSASLDLPAGEIAGAQVAPAGGDPIAEVPTVELAAGTNLIVYAVGSLEEETFTFYTQEVALEAAAPADGGAEAEAVAEGEAAAEGDGTPAPTAVNTGGEVGSSSNSMVLFAAAIGFFALAGGAAVLRRRTVDV
jgi:hypothetical protein